MEKENTFSRFGSVLIITYGRSGSTLLQGILNSIPGYLIRGENENLMAHFYNAYKIIEFGHFYQIYDKDIVTSPQHSWYGFEHLDGKDYTQDIAKLVKKQLFGIENYSDYWVYGFKEIRYLFMEKTELEKYFGFLRIIFPNPAFIFNFRNHDEVLSSAWWKSFDSETWRQEIIDFEKFCLDYFHAHQDFCFINNYNKLIDLESGQACYLFDFLGEPYREADLQKILNLKHSEGNKKHLSSFADIVYTIDFDKFRENKLAYYVVNTYKKQEDKTVVGGLLLMSEQYKVLNVYALDNENQKEFGVYGLPSPLFGKNNLENLNSSLCRYTVPIKSSAYPIKLMVDAEPNLVVHFATLHQ